MTTHSFNLSSISRVQILDAIKVFALVHKADFDLDKITLTANANTWFMVVNHECRDNAIDWYTIKNAVFTGRKYLGCTVKVDTDYPPGLFSVDYAAGEAVMFTVAQPSKPAKEASYD